MIHILKSVFSTCFLSIGLMLALLSLSVAQEYNCKSPQFQQEMNYCAYQDFLEADRQLNEIYPLAIARMKLVDTYYERDQQGAELALREAQRSWVMFRDKACDAEGFLFHGGTMEPLIISGCKARLTRQRSEDLRFLSEIDG